MTEETAKALAEAMNRLAASLDALPKNIMGIQVQHNGIPSWPTQFPVISGPMGQPGSAGYGYAPPHYTTSGNY